MPRTTRTERGPVASASGTLGEFEQLLASNSGEDAFDVAMQLLAAKLVDEWQVAEQGRAPRFTRDGTADAVAARVQALYREAIERWPDLDPGRSRIALAPDQLLRCLRPLCSFRILDSELEHLDAALERLVARGAKGALGQYFTPRAVIRMCVTALGPTAADRIIDPACGSGGFLYEAIKQARAHGTGSPRCLGIDLGQRSIRVATLLSHAVGADALSVHHGNAIDGRALGGASPRAWQPFLAPAGASPEANDAERPWGAFHGLQCSLLLTNPPFAGEIDEAGVLRAYAAQRTRGRGRKGAVGREHLFVERAVNLLAPGGRGAIVVPQGVLANPTAAYLRTWLMARCRVLAVVGLHPFAFLPHTGVKTSVLFIERNRHTGPAPADYPIAFATSGDPGKDSSGRDVGTSDYARIGAELAAFFAAERRPWARAPRVETDARAETVSAAEVAAHDRLDAEYHGHAVRNLHRGLDASAARRIGDRVGRGRSRFDRKSRSAIDYVDISSVDARSGVALPNRIDTGDAPSRASHLLQPGDVLVSTVRPERNVVALITKTDSVPAVASNGFCLLRPEDVAPELLFAFCKTDTFRRLLSRRATASMYPTATDRDVLEMPFFEPDAKTSASIVAKVRDGLAMLETARANIEDAIREMQQAMDAAAREPAPLPSPASTPPRRTR